MTTQNWRDTFIRTRYKDMKNDKLKVPSIVNDENIKLVTEAVTELKQWLLNGIDEYPEYIDDGRQHREAIQSNNEIWEMRKILDEKLKKYISQRR